MFMILPRIPTPPHAPIAAPRTLSGLQIMLAVLITLLVLVGALGLLLNTLFTQLYFGSPPQGDRAVGLVIPFFITVGAALLCTLASLLSACRGGDSLLRLIPTSPFIAGCITIAITFGVAVAAFMAFLCWCEPSMLSRRGSVLIVILGWIGGIIGPLLLATGLLCSAWMSGESVKINPQALRPVMVMFWSLVLIAIVGYSLGGFALYQAFAQQAANRAAALKQALQQQLSREHERALPPAQRLKNELDAMSPETPLWPIVAYFPECTQRFPLDAQCRELLIARILRVPDLDHAMLATVGGQYYLYRQGVADFISAAPMPLIHEHQESWGQALQLAIQTTADSISCRPAWLSETFDLNPDPLAHVQSLLAASERFRGFPIHDRLAKDLQTLANASTELKDDAKQKKLFRVLEKAGYKPVPVATTPESSP